MDFELVNKTDYEQDQRHRHIRKIDRYVKQGKIPQGSGEITVWHRLECPFGKNGKQQMCACDAKIAYNGKVIYDDS